VGPQLRCSPCPTRLLERFKDKTSFGLALERGNREGPVVRELNSFAKSKVHKSDAFFCVHMYVHGRGSIRATRCAGRKTRSTLSSRTEHLFQKAFKPTVIFINTSNRTRSKCLFLGANTENLRATFSSVWAIFPGCRCLPHSKALKEFHFL
jgi:hypothetical protein